MYDPSIADQVDQALVGQDPDGDLVEELAQDFAHYLAESQASEAGGDPRPPEGGEPAGGSPAQRADRGIASEDAHAVARAFRPAAAASDASEGANQAREPGPREQTSGKIDWGALSRGTGGHRSTYNERSGLVTYKTSDTQLLISRDESRFKRLKHAVITSARLLQEQVQEWSRGGFRYKPALVTLTYRPGEEWTPGDVVSFMKSVRAYLARRKIKALYTWVAEIQQQRAETRPWDMVLHYHVMIWLPRGVTLPKPDKRGWWKHGSTKIEWARNAVSYLAKYASKGGCFERVPSGARMSGCGGLEQKRRQERSWWVAPRWVREKWGVEHRPMRAVGGGWLSRLSGEIIRSAWRFAGVMCNGRVIHLRKIESDWAALATLRRGLATE